MPHMASRIVVVGALVLLSAASACAVRIRTAAPAAAGR